MAKALRAGSMHGPAAKLLGTARRRRAALMVTTALQAAFVLVLTFPATKPARAQPAPNARPIGGQVVAGSASISQAPNLTTVTQSSQRAAVNWQSFDVGAQQTVQFAQPSTSATTLNRVTGSNPSQIAGRIDANGQVIVVNQDGVTFYKGAQVNAAGLVVSAAGITNQNFMAGRMVFDQPAAPNARVENRGNITVKQAGLAALVAPQVRNSGVITAKLGHVVLAGARAATLDLYGDGLVSIDVTQQVTQVPLGPGGKPVTALVTNTGTVLADGGTVQLTAQAVDGIVQNLITARGRISAASVGSRTGKIVLAGLGGSITVAGQLAAEGVAPGTRGGQIEVVADGRITLARKARLNASGTFGGGVVAVGTTLRRAKGGPGVKAKMTASSVTVDAGAEISADATGNGNGGRVAILSTGSTQMDGAISATAGPLGGNGGFVEASGQTLGLTGNIDVSAPVGATGTILLDPGTLDIVHSGTSDGSLDGSLSSGSGTLAYNAGGTTVAGTVTDFEIESLGSTGNVVLQATTLLEVGASLNVAHGLTMQSGGDLIVGPGLSIEAGTTLLLGSGIVFPAGTVGAAGAISLGTSLGAGDSLIAPTMILQGGSTGIALNNALLSASSSLDISTAGGGITQLNTGTISTPLLTSSAGIVGTASLMAAGNSITALGAITVTGGNFDLEDASPLAVNGAITAANGNILLQEGSGSALTLSNGLTAGSTGTISLVTDSLAVGGAATIAAGGGGPVALVEIAPASTTVAVSLGGDSGLVLNDQQFGVIKTGTLRIGAFTEPSGVIDVTAPSISFGVSPIDLRTETIAATLDLEANGSINEPASSALSVGTLVGSTNGAAASSFLMHGVRNDIDALGSVSVAGGDFLLDDTAALTVVGPVSAGTPAAPSDSNTASLTISTGGTLAIGAPAVPGSLNAGTVALTAQNTISEPNGSIGANTLTAQSTGGSVLLSGGLDQISTIAALSAAGSIEVVADPSVLTLTGTESGTTLFFKNPAVGGTIALDAATLTATGDTPVVSLVADHLTQPAASTIAATSTGIVDLAPASATADVTVGGPADTLGAVLSAITPATGALVIGGYVGTDGQGTISAHSISVAEALNLGTVAGTLALESNGGVTQGAGDSLLNLEILTGSAEHFALLDGGNQIDAIANLTALGTAGIGVADTNALAVIGTVRAPAGQIYLQSSNAVTLENDGTLAGGTLDSIEAHGFLIDGGGTVLAGPVFELAPTSGALTLAGLAGIGADVLRFGAVTLPGSLTPTTTAGSIAVTGTFGAAGISLELDSLGGIGETAPLVAGTLTGTAGGAVLLTAGNTIGTLGSFTANGFMLVDTTPLTVTGAVAGGPGASITDTGLLTLGRAASVMANAIALNAGSIEIDGLVSDGGAGSTSLTATGGTINEPGMLVSGMLSGTASLSASLTGTNMVGTLAAFTAAGFTLDDSVPLTVTGALAGGPNAVIDDANQSLTVAGAGSVTANAIALSAGNIAIAGLVSDGGAGTTSLVAAGGTISETGTLLSGTLSGSAHGNALLTASNTVAALGSFAVTGGTNGFALDDAAALSVVGTVSAPGQIYLQSSNADGVTLAGGTLAGGTLDSIQANAFTVNAGTVLAGPEFELAPLSGAMTLGASGADLALVSLTGIGPDALRLGAVTLPGSLTPTTTAGSIVVVGTFGSPAITLELDSLGGIGETAPLIAGTLTGTAVGAALLTAGNTISALGSFTAGGFTLDDTIPLAVTGAVAGGPSASITDAGLLTVGNATSVTASAITLNSGSIEIDGLVSDGGAGSTSLIATGGTINEPGTLVSGALSGSAAGAASLVGARLTTNRITGLGPFTASGLTVDDGIALTVTAAVAGGPSATITAAGLLSVAATGSVTANAVSLSGTSLAIAGLVSDGGAGTTSLIATAGTINENGTLISGTLSGSATGAASLLGATPTTNQIADLGPFSASGLTVDDSIALTVGAAVTGGPTATITDAGLLTVAGAGSVSANAISLTGTGIAIAGLVSDGGGGTTSLIATAGTIDETGALISGVLSGSATGAASLLGASPTTNVIADVGPFSANGLTLDDGIGLTVGAAVTGGPSATISDAGLLTVAGVASVTANAVSLTGASITIAGQVSDGGAGTTSLIATGIAGEIRTPGTIAETGTLISGVLSGSATGTASLLGASATTNQIADLGPFSANGLTLDDGIALTVGAAVTGGPSAAITDAGLLTVAGVGSVTANAVRLTGTSMAIAGTVSDGGAGTTSLIAAGGTIDETGTLISGVLSGSATGAASLLGATPTTNGIADLGPFSANGLTVDDGAALTVGAAVSGGPSATITDASVLTVARAGSLIAQAVSLTATAIGIAGLVSDGGAGTTTLLATAGTIGETGTLVSGLLNGSATGAASLLGATPTTNRIANLGPFSANGLTVDDGTALTVGAAVTGGPSATITDAGLLNVGAAGTVTANAISLTGTGLLITGLVSDGGAGTTALIATGGTIDETGTLISGALSGSATGAASLLGVSPTTNQIADLGPFSASGIALDDGIALNVDAAVAGGPSATITDAAALTVAGSGSVLAQAVSLVATGIGIAGLVSDGGAGTTHLLATSGAITETGTLTSGTLSGSATAGASLLGATPTTNLIANLGPFSALGFTADDGIALTVGAAVSGGPSATITGAGLLTVAGAGSVTANVVSLTGTAIGIAGTVSDGGAGTTHLLATGGSINETGTLISGALSGSATGAANLPGATPTTNQIADLGPFTAVGIALNDGAALLINGAVAGGPSAAITDSGLLTVASSVTATAVNLSAASLAIPGLVSDGGVGTTQLVASTGSITETGALISGALSGGAAEAASLIGSNAILALGAFATGSGLTLVDTGNLTVNGPVSAGSSAAITDAGTLAVAGSLAGTAVQLRAGAIVVPGAIDAGGTLTLLSSSTIGETGRVVTPLLTGSAPGSASLTGANQIGQIGGFSANGLTVNDATNLLLSGTLTSPLIIINDAGFPIALGNKATIVTGGIARPTGRLTKPPPTSDGGAFLTDFQQVGNSFVTGLDGGPSILVITAGAGQNVVFDPAGGLHAPDTWLVLDLAAGDKAGGTVFVKALDVFYPGVGTGSTNLFGTINGVSGVVAAGAGNIQTSANANYRFNDCPIGSVNCVLLPVEGIPTGNPLNDFDLGAVSNPNDDDDLLLPAVSDQDY